jgi:hypothetical protein
VQRKQQVFERPQKKERAMQNKDRELTGQSQDVANGSGRLGECLLQELGNAQWTQFHAAVAWIKRSALNHLAHSLEQFDNRAEVRLSVGIDLHETSREGLEDLLRSISRGEVWIFHNDFSTATFHPIYVFRNTTRAKVILGEEAVAIPLDMRVPADAQFLATVEQGLHAWSHELQGHCRRLDGELLNLGTDPFAPIP